MKKQFLIPVLLFLTLCASGQRKSERGYIINNDSTITNGFIAIKTSYLYSDHILFKAFDDGPFARYGPTEIGGYVIEPGRRYESICQNNACRFYEYLAEGRLDLLRLEEPGSTLFFMKSYEKSPVLLYYKETLVDNRYRHEVEAYKAQLKEEMADCESLAADIDNLRAYEAKFLSEIFLKYNRCVSLSTEASAEDTRQSKSMFVGLFAGKAFSTPEYFLGGVQVDVFGRNKIVFGSLFYQRGMINRKIVFPGQQSAKIQSRLNQVGLKMNVLVVSLRYAEPYVFGSFGYIRYTNDIVQAEWTRKVSALSFGAGAGLKFNISPKMILKSELGLHFIPGKNVLDDITFTVGEIVFKTTPLTSVNIAVAYKIAD
jgi:hypothetical protein